MKPYHTSFLRVAACIMLLSSVSFFTSQKASANCNLFSLSTKDTTWSFTAAIGTTQSRYLTITNTSDSVLVLDAVVNSTSLFSLNQTQFTIPAHDTVTILITFAPTTAANTTTVSGNIRFAQHGTDCRQYLGLSGTITGSTGGHDKVVKFSPTAEDFPAVPAGKDTCMVMYLVNYTGGQVKIESMSLLHGNTNFKIDPAFTTGSMDSGGYYRFQVCCTGDASHTEFSDSIIVTYSDGTGLHTIGALLVGHTSSNTTSGDILVADPHAFSLINVANGTTACQNVVVTNKSQSTVVITGWHHCDGTLFSVTPGFTGNDTLAAGASMTFTICYTPAGTDSNADACSLTVNYSTGDPSSTGKTLVVSFYGTSPRSNTTGGDACLKTEQGDNYHDAIVVGTTADHTLHLINNTSRSITINSATITGTDAAVFAIVTSLPITVPANSTSTLLTYSFSPTTTSKTEYTAIVTLGLSGDSINCKSCDGHLIGYAVHSTTSTDSTVRPIFPNDHRTLVVEGSTRTTSRTFYFTNNLTVDCTVNKIYMAIGTYFAITSTNPSPAPFTLHPGDNLSVVVTYTATDNQVHHDSLMIDANHNLLAQGFDVQGLQVAAGVANALPSGVAINVSPNPASSYVTVDMAGIRSADIQVIDLLGKTITTATASTTWKWNASNAVTGSYIVRIAGESTSGEQFVASKRVIVSK